MTTLNPEPNNVYNCDALTLLSAMGDESVQTIITSPPYFGLRQYTDGDTREIGRETSIHAYIEGLVAIFREARRVLRRDGTLWLNLGDSYSTHAAGRVVEPFKNSGLTKTRTAIAAREAKVNQEVYRNSHLPEKNLLMIPARVAIALQDDGWILRSDIIWSKGNPMPESVTDRPTKAHEYVFLFAKSPRYYYDSEAIKEKAVDGDARQPRGSKGVDRPNAGLRKQDDLGKRQYTGFNDRYFNKPPVAYRNKRSVWQVNTQPLPEAHFAAFPPMLVEPMILAGAPPGGLVLDPFFGAGTVGLVAQRRNRQFIGCDINPDYVELARRRLARPYTVSMFDIAW